jgi:hypothetical protein
MSVFNGERFLHEAIESILSQSFRDLEFIIINDGSTDGTSGILDYYARKDARVRVCHQQNKGFNVSLNFGVRSARGKYIARMDADDIAISDRLMRQVKVMEKNPDLGIVGGAIHIIDAIGDSVGFERFPTNDQQIKEMLLQGSCALCHPAVLMRTEVVLALGGYRPIALDASDYDLWLRISDRFLMANLPDAVLKYRRHTSQVSIRKFKQQALSALAARAAALSRRKGNGDPLDATRDISPSILEQLGLGEAEQSAVVARGYLTCIRSMSDAGESSLAKDTMRELLNSPAWARANRALVADSHLLKARLHWREGRFARSAFSALHAVITRPIVLGRPLKPMMRQLGLLSQ